MDPFSAEGELVNIHTAFHQSQYQAVVDYDTSSISPSNKSAVSILKLRSQIALRQYAPILSSISPSAASSNPDLAAARILAQSCSSPTASQAKVLAEADKLVASSGDALGVQLLLGTLYVRLGELDKALALLRRHQGSLDAVALIVQVLLLQNRADLAAKECKSARGFAQDALLVNLGEAWVGMREGGEKYQQAYYVFEELAQAPTASAAPSLTAQAVSELHLGRYPEAETALQQALAADPNDADALANTAVLNTILGKKDEAEAAVAKLKATDSTHPFVVEMEKRQGAFDEAARKYNPKFEA